MKGLSRRQFVQVTSAGVLVAACGDDERKVVADTTDTAVPPDTAAPEVDTVAPDTEPPDTEPPDTAPPDTAPPDTVADAGPEADVGPAAIGTFDPQSITVAARQSFLYGVQAGDATSDGAVLWTRFAAVDPEQWLELVVFADGAPDSAGDMYVREQASIADGGFVHVEVAGLGADTPYRYCFVARDSVGEARNRSPIGRFRTALAADGMRVVVFGGVSCVNADHQPYRTLNRAAEADLDFFLLNGDTTYCDGAHTLDDYRDKWRASFDSDGYRALLGSVANYATWDDHEVEDNWNPELVPAKQLRAAKQTFLEHIALRLQVDGDPVAGWKIWRSYRWGKTLEVFVLDCRGERIPSTRLTAEAQYISPEQMQWLKLGLRHSPCTFKLIMNSVPITNMPNGYPSEKDRWEGYENQRDEILSHVEGPPLLPGVLWLSGDFHFGCIAMVEPPGERFSDQWEIFMGQGANAANPAWEPLAASDSDQLIYLTGTDNYVRFTCDPFASPPTITAETIDGDGTVMNTHVFEFPS